MKSSLYYRREFNGARARKMLISLAPVLIILLLLFPHTSFSKDSVKNKGRSWYLVGTVKNAPATIKTGKQSRKTTLRGSLVLKASEHPKRGIQLQLENLSLRGRPIKTMKGNSGGISLYVLPAMTARTKVEYSRAKNNLTSAFPMTLHYTLIDKIKGFRTSKEKQPHDFSPFTEKGKGKLSGSFQKPIKPPLLPERVL
ncbi:MAG: hypothetical protein MI685_07755 [Chlorobiales bacterium]|nr:hypothetical protein [Chlorobiales bacterium]